MPEEIEVTPWTAARLWREARRALAACLLLMTARVTPSEDHATLRALRDAGSAMRSTEG